MRESRTYGSGRGACDETHVPTATGFAASAHSRLWHFASRNGALNLRLLLEVLRKHRDRRPGSSPSRMPSRPGELHPEPLTDPDLTLSRHPARATARRLPPSVENWSSSCCQLARSQRR
jgi:hypothetical protein